MRDNGANGIVNAIENWYYTRHAPTAQTPQPDSIPLRNPAPLRFTTALPRLQVSHGSGSPLRNEGQWVSGRKAADGQPAIYTSFIRPDNVHPSVLVGVALIRQSVSNAHLVAGTREPGTGPWPGDAAVPSNEVSHLLATFNSGFKAKDITGGFYLNGRYSRNLVDGEASAVITADGHISVGAWNQDVRMSPAVIAVRQNLHLIVASGKQEPDLNINAGGAWGSASNQLQYTWRSGLGTDIHGNLIYVAGDGLTLETLANALVQSGAIQGMELDIHYGQVNFSSWTPRGNLALPTQLLPSMPKSPSRYLASDQRDFFYLTVK
ncbi:hypothetical protein [Paeniglutamicibacter cryotolerans]|uniref:hypothetical protein n=1 Tax=Paeniglutamicibacter cryotolerans TaxID=670079 RepID=UPI001C8583B1|nr:hypothetical protein [Paeniglutamicibacter cryotolerans]